jgi:cation transport ATPase
VHFGVGRRFYVAAWKGLQHGAMGMAGTTMSYTYSFVSMVGSVLDENYQGQHFFESSAIVTLESEGGRLVGAGQVAAQDPHRAGAARRPAADCA